MASNRSSGDLSWQLFSSQAAPRSFWVAWAVSLGTIAVGFALYAALLLVVVIRWRQMARKNVPRDSKMRRLVFWVLVNAVCNLCNAAQMTASVVATRQASAAAQEPRCRALQKLGVMLFGLASSASYWFLVVRAEATLDRRSYWHMNVYRLCKLGLVVGVPGLMAVSAIMFEGRVLFGWACTLEMSPVLAATFMLLDLGLSVMLLLLFYIPVRKHLAKLKHSGDGDALQKQARRLHGRALRVLRLSLVQVFSTLIVQLIGLGTQIFHDDAEAPEMAYWRHVRYILYGVDLWINTGCMLIMSTSWVPEGWTRLQTALHRVRRARLPWQRAPAKSPTVVPAATEQSSTRQDHSPASST